MQRQRRADEIERAELVRQRGYVCLDELDVPRRPRAALVEQLRPDVDADHLAHKRRERNRERPGAGTDIKCALLTGQGQQSAQTLLHRCHAAVVLQYVYGQSHQQIAERLQVSPRMVKQYVGQALGLCRRRMASWG